MMFIENAKPKPPVNTNLKTTLDAADFYLFDCHGLVVLRNAISQDKIAEVQRLVDKTWPTKKLWKFPVLHLGGVFWDLMTTQVVLDFAEKVCSEYFRVDHAFGVSGESSVPNLHGGPNTSQRTCFFNRVGTNYPLVGQLSIGFNIHPQSPATGGMCYIPGSHKAYDEREGKLVRKEILGTIDREGVIVPTLYPGDVIVFSESLVHGDTGQKVSGQSRMQIYYKYAPGWLAWRDPRQQEKYLKYARNDLERRLIEPAYSATYNDDNNTMDVTNTRRLETLKHA